MSTNIMSVNWFITNWWESTFKWWRRNYEIIVIENLGFQIKYRKVWAKLKINLIDRYVYRRKFWFICKWKIELRRKSYRGRRIIVWWFIFKFQHF